MLNEIIDAMDADNTTDYKVYIKRIFDFIKENQHIYSKVASSPDAVFFIDKIKHIITTRVLSNVKSPYLSKNKAVRHVQISFVANACVDVMVNYFRGEIKMSFDELEKTVVELIDKFM